MPEGGRAGAHTGAHSQTCADCLGSVPLMIASQDSHKKEQIKPFLQDGRAVLKSRCINSQVTGKALGLLTYVPPRSQLLQLAGSGLLTPALHSPGKPPFPHPAPPLRQPLPPASVPVLSKPSLSSAPAPFRPSLQPQTKQSESPIWADSIVFREAKSRKEAC